MLISCQNDTQMHRHHLGQSSKRQRGRQQVLEWELKSNFLKWPVLHLRTNYTVKAIASNGGSIELKVLSRNQQDTANTWTAVMVAVGDNTDFRCRDGVEKVVDWPNSLISCTDATLFVSPGYFWTRSSASWRASDTVAVWSVFSLVGMNDAPREKATGLVQNRAMFHLRRRRCEREAASTLLDSREKSRGRG